MTYSERAPRLWILINGAQIWSRGANLIPMDEMDGRLTEQAYHFMLKSAQDSNYNTLRVPSLDNIRGPSHAPVAARAYTLHEAVCCLGGEIPQLGEVSPGAPLMGGIQLMSW